MSAQDPKDWMQDPATLSEEIDATRADAGQTLDALQQKLSPSQLFDQSLTYLSERGYDLACGIGRAAREHPVPFALAAAGVIWYMSRRRSGDDVEIELDPELEADALGGFEGDDYLAPSEEYASGSTADYGGTEYGGESATRRATQKARAATAQATAAVGRGTRRAKREVSHMLRDQPLLVGAIGLAIGAAVAALVPVSEGEDRLFGEKGERFVRRAREKVGEQVERARETARRAADAAKNAISESDRSGGATGNGSGTSQGTASGPSMQPNP